MYWFGGEWGRVLLWGTAALFVLPLAAAPAGLFLNGHRIGAVLAGVAWLAAAAYFAYRGYAAIP